MRKAFSRQIYSCTLLLPFLSIWFNWTPRDAELLGNGLSIPWHVLFNHLFTEVPEVTSLVKWRSHVSHQRFQFYKHTSIGWVSIVVKTLWRQRNTPRNNWLQQWWFIVGVSHKNDWMHLCFCIMFVIRLKHENVQGWWMHVSTFMSTLLSPLVILPG